MCERMERFSLLSFVFVSSLVVGCGRIFLKIASNYRRIYSAEEVIEAVLDLLDAMASFCFMGQSGV